MAVVTAVAYAGCRRYDEMTKTTVLLYDLEPGPEKDYQVLHDAFDALRSSACAWHVEAEGDVADRKRSAGATSVVRKSSITLSKGDPPFVRTNIDIPRVPVGRQTLYFLPDRILVFEQNGVGAVRYRDLHVERRATRFIEDGAVPKDATIVGRTWQYVNKKGGPDRRFKDNRELPIALYEELHLTSDGGLNELLQLSKKDIAAELEAALRNLASSAAEDASSVA